LPPTLSIAARTEIEPVPLARMPARAAAEIDERDEQRQQALVLPAATGVLSLQEELEQIEAEMTEQASAVSAGERLRRVLSTLSATLSTRPAQATIAGTTVVVLLLAALSAQPRAAESSEGGAGPSRANQPSQSRAAAAGQATSSADSTSPLVRTSAGSVALRPVSSAQSASASTREPEQRSPRETSRDRGNDTPSLELSRNLRLPVAAVSVGRADSIARASEQAPGVGEGFSKQFWTSGIDKRAAESSTGPTSARLLGSMPEPTYPVFLRKNNVEGEVVVQFVVDETGKPDMSTLEVVRSPHDAMTASVRKVIEQIRFEPARTGGTNPKARTEVVRSSFLFKAGGK
jgi:TonB family protein